MRARPLGFYHCVEHLGLAQADCLEANWATEGRGDHSFDEAIELTGNGTLQTKVAS